MKLKDVKGLSATICRTLGTAGREDEVVDILLKGCCGDTAATTSSGPTLFSRARDAFCDRYRAINHSGYYWTAKDAGALKQLLNKIRSKMVERQMDDTDDAVVESLIIFLGSITEKWYLSNFSVSILNGKFNEIYAGIRQHATGNQGAGVSDLKARASEVLRRSGSCNGQ